MTLLQKVVFFFCSNVLFYYFTMQISRESIDAVKKYWKKDMSKDDWKLIIELKKTFEIM